MISMFGAALSVLLAATVTTVPAPGLAVGNITLSHGSVWQTKKAGDETEGFILIHNDSQQPDTLTKWSCPLADTTTLLGADGKPVQSLVIPPKQTVTLSSSGLHLVLQSTHFTVQRGSIVPCTLTFEQQGDIQAMLYAKKAPK